MKREKRLTKRERKEQSGGAPHDHGHIHCVACGRHIDQQEIGASPATATMIVCAHGSQFASCVGCEATSRYLVDEHDRTGKPVQQAAAWH